MEEHEAFVGAPSPPRVLIVDDDAAIRLICATWLNLDGYEVIEAVNGRDALELAFSEAPDVVLLDLSMPVLDGFALAEALRADDRTRELPLIVLSGETGRSVTERVSEIGAAGFFTKPFDPGVVADFVRGVVSELKVTNGRASAPAGGRAF